MSPILFILLAMLVGCASGAQTSRATPGTAGDAAEREEGGLRLSLKLGKPSYKVGEPVTMTLTVTNVSQATFQDNLGTSQVYDFLVTREGKEVWRWSADRLFLQVITPFSLGAAQSRQFRETWRQVDNEGRKISPGSYQIVGVLKTRPERSTPAVAVEAR